MLVLRPLFSIPPGTEMFYFPGCARYRNDSVADKSAGFPHSEISGSKVAWHLPGAYRSLSCVLHRLLESRHPPYALKFPIRKFKNHNFSARARMRARINVLTCYVTSMPHNSFASTASYDAVDYLPVCDTYKRPNVNWWHRDRIQFSICNLSDKKTAFRGS